MPQSVCCGCKIWDLETAPLSGSKWVLILLEQAIDQKFVGAEPSLVVAAAHTVFKLK